MRWAVASGVVCVVYEMAGFGVGSCVLEFAFRPIRSASIIVCEF